MEKKMKFKMLSLSLVFFTVVVFGQEVKVPKVMQEVLTKLYPKAAEVKWNKEGKTEYEASFKDGKTPTSIVLDGKGKLLETEVDIAITELSKEIQSFVQKNYISYKITEAAKIIDSKGVVTFEAEITKNKLKKDLIFDKDGNPIVKKKIKQGKN
jgi:NCAIR mutase (PurE)-related protein